MTGDRHVRFLGGGFAETRSRYPTERFPRTVPANVTVRSVAVHRPLVNAPELKAGLGPFADSQPRVAVVAVSGLLALADIAGGCRFHRRRPCCRSTGRGTRRVPGVLRSLAQLGARRSPQRAAGPGRTCLRLGGADPIVAAAVTVGVLIARPALRLRTQARGVERRASSLQKLEIDLLVGRVSDGVLVLEARP